MNAMTATLPAEAQAAAAEIEAATGRARGQLGDYPSTTIKTHLRRFAVAMGVDTHAARDGRVTTEQLRQLYDGHTTADTIMAGLTIEAPAPKPQPFPAPQPARSAPPSAAPAQPAPEAANALANALAALMASQQQPAPAVDAEQVRAIVADAIAGHLDALPDLVAEVVAKHTKRIEITAPGKPPVTIEQAHRLLPRVVRYLSRNLACYVVGPAGSGKTTLAEQAAKALGRPFHFTGALDSPFALLGYRDAAGIYHRTPFREAFEHGGVFLFDEVDASDPAALIPFNAALANRLATFPDAGQMKAHPDFVAIAAANTYGRGADRQYVGRNQLDAATLDRFAVMECDYDEQLELALSSNEKWTRHVQKVRAAIEREKVRHVVSPRASIMGAQAIAAGDTWAEAEDAFIWKGMDKATRDRVATAMGRLA